MVVVVVEGVMMPAGMVLDCLVGRDYRLEEGGWGCLVILGCDKEGREKGGGRRRKEGSSIGIRCRKTNRNRLGKA